MLVAEEARELLDSIRIPLLLTFCKIVMPMQG